MRKALLLSMAIAGAASAADRDITSYGALCNGGDDRSAVQSAINAMANGDRLVVPCLASIGGSGLLISGKSNITVQGTASGAGFRALSGIVQGIPSHTTNVLLLVQGCTNCVVRDLVFAGNGTATGLFSYQSSTGSSFINNTAGNVIHPSSCIVCTGANSNMTYSGNTIGPSGYDAGADQGPRGMWLGNGTSGNVETNVTVENNTISNCGASGQVFHGNSGTFNNNVWTGNRGSGMKTVANGTNSGTVYVTDNIIEANVFNGLQIELGGPTYIITGNTFDGQSVANSSGIYVSGSYVHDFDISDNVFKNFPPNGAGINLIANNGNSNITNGTISNNHIFSNAGQGILMEAHVAGAMTNITISANDIRSNGTGILALAQNSTASSSGISVTGNAIFGNNNGYIIDTVTAGNYSSFTQSGNCWGNTVANISDDRPGGFSNPSSSGSCADPTSGGITIGVSPSSAILYASQTQQFTATGGTVSWSRSPAVGTINSTGLYTAPSSIASTSTVTITATSTADGSKSDTATVTLQPPLSVPIRIDVGGIEPFTDGAGNVWLPDQNYSGGTVDAPISNPIAGTTDDALYQRERWGATTYTFSGLANGSYTVRLLMCETYFNATGARRFHIDINGTRVATNLDIFQETGAQFTALIKTYSATVSSGTLTIATSQGTADEPTMHAIEITGEIVIDVSPSAASLYASQTQQFTATGGSVTWNRSPSVGTISGSGLYTAPSSISSSSSVTVTATSTVDGSKSDTATVTLLPPGAPPKSTATSGRVAIGGGRVFVQ